MQVGSKYKNETNLEHLQEIILAHFETDKGLFLFDRVLGAHFQVFVVARRDKSKSVRENINSVTVASKRKHAYFEHFPYRSSFMAIS